MATTTAPGATEFDGKFAYFYGIILPVIGSLGIIGNITSFVVLNQRYMRSSCNLYLLILTLVDSLYLGVLMVIYMPEALLWLQSSDRRVSGDMLSAFIHMYPLLEIIQVMTIAFTVAATFDQYFFYFKPEKTVQMLTWRKAIKVSVIIIGFVFILHFLNIFKLVEKRTILDPNLPPDEGGEIVQICLSTLYDSEGFQILDRYLLFVCFYAIPVVVLFIMIMILYHKNRVSSRGDEKPVWYFQEGRSNITIMTIGGLCIVCSLPYIVFTIIGYVTHPGYVDELHCLNNMVDFRFIDRANAELTTVILGSTYSSIKFPIYMWFNTQFHHHFYLLVTCTTKSADEDDRKPSHDPPNCVGEGSTGSGQHFKVMIVEPKDKRKRPQVPVQPFYINSMAADSAAPLMGVAAIGSSISPYEDGSDDVFAPNGLLVPNGRPNGRLPNRQPGQRSSAQRNRPGNIERLQVPNRHNRRYRHNSDTDSYHRVLPRIPIRQREETPINQRRHNKYAYDNTAMQYEPEEWPWTAGQQPYGANQLNGRIPPLPQHYADKRFYDRRPEATQRASYPMVQRRRDPQNYRENAVQRPQSMGNPIRPWQIGDYDDGTSGIWI